MKWWTISLIIIFILLLFPILFLFFPGIILLILFFVVIIFCSYRFKKTKNYFYLIIILVILAFILYMSFTVHAPIKVRVINALTQQPVENIQVVREVKGTLITILLFEAGSDELKAQKGLSSHEGKYDFGWIFSVNFPFVIYFDMDNIRFGNRDPGEKYIDENKFNSFIYAYSIDGSKIQGNLNYENDEIDVPNFLAIRSTMRFSFFTKKIDLYVFPLVNKLEDCDIIQSDYLKKSCKQANIDNVAIITNDAKLCSLWKDSSFEESCIFDVAWKNDNAVACELLENILSVSPEDISFCKREVATLSVNHSLCESIPNSVWRDYGDGRMQCLENYPDY